MEIVIGIGVAVFLVVGILLLKKANKKADETTNESQQTNIPDAGCCGAHEVCDFDAIKADESRIEYYDDEELDVYKNMDEKSYTPNQIEEFREVLYTLNTNEIRYWLLSIERRKIRLPEILKSEALLLMAEV